MLINEYNKQLLDEVEHDIMNYQNRGLCYLLSQTNQVCGWICFFRLSYFDRTDLQLFAIFMAKKLVVPRCVQIVSKRLVSQTSCSIVKCLVY